VPNAHACAACGSLRHIGRAVSSCARVVARSEHGGADRHSTLTRLLDLRAHTSAELTLSTETPRALGRSRIKSGVFPGKP